MLNIFSSIIAYEAFQRKHFNIYSLARPFMGPFFRPTEIMQVYSCTILNNYT